MEAPSLWPSTFSSAIYNTYLATRPRNTGASAKAGRASNVLHLGQQSCHHVPVNSCQVRILDTTDSLATSNAAFTSKLAMETVFYQRPACVHN